MPRGSRGERRPADVIGAAVMVAGIATAVEAFTTCREHLGRLSLPRPTLHA